MEGSKPLPNANHNFPAKPDIWKFWGTPLQKSYFKALGLYLAYSFTYVGINYYLTRNEIGDYNLETMKTEEEVDLFMRTHKQDTKVMDLQLPLHIRNADMFGAGSKDPNNPNIVFDDGVDYVRTPRGACIPYLPNAL